MSEAIVCPACGARMRHHRKRCLRCGRDLPAPRPGEQGQVRSWLEARWRLLAAGAGLLLLVALSVALFPAGGGTPDAGVPASVQAARTAAGPPAAAAGSRRADAPAPPPAVADPEFVGRTAYREGDYQAALERYKDATDRNPNDAESQSNCGQALVRLGRPAEAIPYFERAIALNKDRWAYHFNLAHARGLLEQWDQAIQEYQVAAGLFPDDYATEYNLGMAFHKRGDEAPAVEHFRRAIDLAPTEPDFQLSLGISSERLGRTADALAAFRRYLELAPQGGQAANVRAHIEALAKTPPEPASPPPPPKSSVS